MSVFHGCFSGEATCVAVGDAPCPSGFRGAADTAMHGDRVAAALGAGSVGDGNHARPPVQVAKRESRKGLQVGRIGPCRKTTACLRRSSAAA